MNVSLTPGVGVARLMGTLAFDSHQQHHDLTAGCIDHVDM